MSKGGDALTVNSFVGYLGPATRTAVVSGGGGAFTDVADTALYDPAAPDAAGGAGIGPVRVLRPTVSGNVVITLWDDDTTTAGLKKTIAVTSGNLVTNFLIRKIWATGTTATVDALA